MADVSHKKRADSVTGDKMVEHLSVVVQDDKVEQNVAIVKDWTDAEERKIKLKLDCILIPCLMLGFFALQLDKSNISSAITTDFTKDLGITNNIVNAGNQLQIAGIVIFEIPSNMIMSKLGAPRWLSFEVFAWGMVATFQAFMHNQSSFYATRFLLGTFEAGYLAGALVVIGSFYTKTEVAMRMTVLYTSNYLAAGTSSLVAAGVFQLDRLAGLHDWQWLFLLDGIFTVVVAILFLFLLPGKPQNTQPAIGLKCFDQFTPREREIMSKRIAIEDKGRSVELEAITPREAIRYLFSDYIIWMHSFIAIISLVPKGGLLLYAPTIVKNLGFSTINANLLVSVTHFALIVLTIIAARASDWLQTRGPVCLVCTVYALVFAGVQFALVQSTNKWLKYAIFVLFMAGNATFQGINSAWMSSNIRDPKAVAVGQALVVMAANLGGLAGQQLFRDDDAPKYVRAFTAIIGIYAATLVVIGVLIAVYVFKNRRLDSSSADIGEGDSLNEKKNQI